MLLTPFLTAALETALNKLLFRDRSLQGARRRLVGKVLAISVAELDTPLFLVFSERQIDVLSVWEDPADCTVSTRCAILPQLRDRQQLTALIRSGDLLVEGDIQVVQQWVALLDLAEWDVAELLAPYIGDIAAQSLSQLASGGCRVLQRQMCRQQRYLAEALTEEWKLAPGHLEFAWFADEVEEIQRNVDACAARLAQLEGKL